MAPKRKVVVATLAGALVTLTIGILQIADPALGNQIGAVMAGAAVTVFSFVLAYLIPEADQA